MHPIPTQVDEKNPTFKCWNCGKTFKSEFGIADTINESVAFTSCPKCGKVCTTRLHGKPFVNNKIVE